MFQLNIKQSIQGLLQLRGNRISNNPKPHRLRGWQAHALMIGLSLLGLVWAFQPWKLDPRLPLAYGHDAMSILLWTKSVVDEGWWLSNHYVGAPGQLDMHDYPTSSNVHFLALKLLTIFTHDASKLIMIYYFLTFPLTGWSCFYVLRTMGLGLGNGLIGGMLYAFTYFHFFRGPSHLFLSAYQFIPLMVLVWIWLTEDRPYLITRNPETGRLGLLWGEGRTWGTLAILAGVTSDFPYTPLFALLLLVPVSIYALSLTCTREKATACVLVGVLLATGFVLNMAPTFIYRMQHGPNTSGDLTSIRPWTDSEDYGLKLIQLLLPSPDHPLQSMRNLRNEYYAKTHVVSEADSMSMGLAASVGLIWLLARLFWGGATTPASRTLRLMSLLTIGCFLISGIGGIGTILNFLSFPSARCFSRISIFIVFFSIAAFVFLLQPLVAAWKDGSPGTRLLIATLLVGILTGGMYDQVGKLHHRDWQSKHRETFESDRAFVRAVEASVPEGTMIFQFPEVAWLSYQNIKGKMEPYDHLRGYVHSKRLRWSFGAMCGRETAHRHHLVAKLPLEQSVEMLATWGFRGIYIDRHGYANPELEIEAPLRNLLERSPIVSRDGRLVFFSLEKYCSRPEFIASEDRRKSELEKRFDAPRINWKKGMHAEEPDVQGKPFRWCLGSGTFEVENRLNRSCFVQLSMGTFSYSAGEYEIRLKVGEEWKRFPVRQTPDRHKIDFILPPGKTMVEWQSNVPGVAVTDRTIHFMMMDVKCELLEK